MRQSVLEEPPESRTIGARRLVRAASGSAATTIWLAALGLVTTPYMLNELGPAAYGVFALVTLVSNYLSNLELGFGHGLIRFAARAHASGDATAERRVLETSLTVFGAAGVAASAIAFALAPTIVNDLATMPASIRSEATTALRVGAVILLMVVLSNYASSALTALGRFAQVNSVRAVNGTIVSAAAVTTVYLGGGVDDVLLTQLVVGTVAICYLATAVTRTQRRRIVPRLHRPTFTEMARYSGFVFLGGIAYQLVLQAPPTVLAASVDTAELASYAVPATVAQHVTLLATSASLGFLPLASAESASADTSRLAAIFRSHLRLTLLVLGPITAYLWIFADEILTAWIGAGFANEAADPLRFLIASSLVFALAAPAADVARGLGRPGWLVWFGCAAAALEIALALALVGRHGASGVAAAMCMGLALAAVPLVVAVSRRLLGLSLRSVLGALATPAMVVTGTAALYGSGAAVTDGFVGALVAGLLATAAHVLVSYRYVLLDSERRAFASAGPRILRSRWRVRRNGGPGEGLSDT